MSEAIRIKCLVRNNFNKRELNILRKNGFFSSSVTSINGSFHFYLFLDDYLNSSKINSNLFNLFFFDDFNYFDGDFSLNFIREKLCYVKDIYKDFLGDKIIHINFKEIFSKEDYVVLRVPLKLTSNSKDFILNVNVFQVFHSILIKCKASNIPECLNYEIPSNNKKKSISIKDLFFKNITILENENTVFSLIKNNK